MPVQYDSNPPQLQIDPDSVQNFIIAQTGQRFGGIINLVSGMVYIHPTVPKIGDVDFTRNGESIGLADSLGVNGGPHAWMVITFSKGHSNDHAGFSLEKTAREPKLTVRSGLNTVAFTGAPPELDTERIMPPLWADALLDLLNANLPVGGKSAGCVIV